MLTEPKTRKRIVRDSKRVMRRAGDYFTSMV
jgi:hypothetical protein